MSATMGYEGMGHTGKINHVGGGGIVHTFTHIFLNTEWHNKNIVDLVMTQNYENIPVVSKYNKNEPTSI